MGFRSSDWLFLAFTLLVGFFLFLDEEPCLDPTDWNIAHSVLFLLTTLVVVWDNIIRARYGQFVYKDQVLLFATFSFWFAMENYARLIVVIFCFHCLTPLELELVELVEIHQSLLIWHSRDILPALLLLCSAFFVAQQLAAGAAWAAGRTTLVASFAVLLLLVVSLLILLWDFIASTLTGTSLRPTPQSHYNSGRSALAYDMVHAVADTFDWHISTGDVFVARFEDLYFFFLQLFNVVALYSCAWVWLFLTLDALAAARASISLGSASTASSSFTFLACGLRWLDHGLWCFWYSHAAVALTGLRVFLRVTINVSV